ncbi:amino acid ABC transporter permease [Agrococcus sp. ARC_14]|uniref:amino acid ABC transporter permease n=1 Tax=Agrococcus sp. ARC_14 TaxID=2919927 RepID=UPI001F05D0E7|nr:amino acid ABC transporter permease [Agrococcus sp. ARC_14]MCH1883979.1 amino acid ABC transporter permease [Agrococcus sp. ARC_14]
MNFDVIFSNLPFMLSGLGLSLGLAAVSIVGSFLLGVLFAAGRISTRPYLRYPSIAYIELVRSIPLIIFILYIFFGLAGLGINVDPFWSAALALTIFASAYVAEVIRAGILGIKPGQMEAARASGLSYFQAMRLVVLPQAVRSMSPALVSEFIKLVKDSSLAAVVGVFEFFNRVNLVNSRELTEPFMLFGFAALVYFVLNFSLSQAARRMELRADV